jgi:hypothetical protein
LAKNALSGLEKRDRMERNKGTTIYLLVGGTTFFVKTKLLPNIILDRTRFIHLFSIIYFFDISISLESFFQSLVLWVYKNNSFALFLNNINSRKVFFLNN